MRIIGVARFGMGDRTGKASKLTREGPMGINQEKSLRVGEEHSKDIYNEESISFVFKH